MLARRILVVDDNDADVALLSRLLERGDDATYEFATADHGEAALELIGSFSPDVVLLDFDLPDMNGLEFLDELRRAGDARPPVVLAITGQSDPRVAAELIRRGALDYIAKTDITEDALRLAVRQAVRAGVMREALDRRTREREISRAQLVASLDRASYLASVSEVLMRSLDARSVLDTVATLTLPQLGDGCLIDVLEHGSLVRAAVELRPALAAKVDRRLLLRAPALDGVEGVARALRSSSAATYRSTWLRAVARWDPGIRALVDANAIASLIVVPLVFDERALGVLSFVAGDAHGEHAQDVAEEIGRRASAALANARAFEEQRAAVAASELARRRLHVISRVSEVFARSLEWRSAIGAVADVLVSSFCARATVTITDGGQHVTGFSPAAPRGEAHVVAAATVETGKAVFTAAGPEPTISVPIPGAGGSVAGVLTISNPPERRFTLDDLAVVEDLGRRTGMFVENARLFERERDIARTLQTSLLPLELPALDGVDFAARCLAGVEGVDVGGDWYDVVRLPRNAVAFAVGDVAGRGVLAAAAMGQLRSSLRAYALEGLEPGDALAKLNAFVLSQERITEFATVGLGVFDTATGVLRYASAGHLPPLVIDPSGNVSLLTIANALPVGLLADTFYEQNEYRLAPGTTIALYTDGLVESRVRPIDTGLTELLTLAEERHADAAAFVDAAIARLSTDAADDVTLLAMRFMPTAVALDGPASTPGIAVTYPAIPPSAGAVRQRLGTFLATIDFPPSRVLDVQVAAGEAVANAVEHAYAGVAQPGLVTLRAQLAARDLVIEIIDHGVWRQVRRPVVTEPFAERGRGITLMRALADDVQLKNDGDGTRVSLRFDTVADRSPALGPA